MLGRDEFSIDLLLTDVVMPQMSGRELADIAKERQSDIKVLLVSGYPRDAIVRAGRLETGVDLISKPFNYITLASKVRDLLDR